MNTHQQPSREKLLKEFKDNLAVLGIQGADRIFMIKWLDEFAFPNLLTSHSEAIRERVNSNRKDAIEIRDQYFPNTKGEPLPNEEWADIINWKNAYNSAHDDILALLNDSDV